MTRTAKAVEAQHGAYTNTVSPATMRGHDIGGEPGILYRVALYRDLLHPITGEYAVVAISEVVDPHQ